MSERKETHNGRDTSGNFKVKREDVDDLTADPAGEEYLRDDVRLGGAVEDTGAQAGARGVRIGDLVEENRENVDRAVDGGEARGSNRQA
jgi:hypothetical protein